MAASLAEVLLRFGRSCLARHALGSACARAWRAIVACRTPLLGGQLWRCEDCGNEQWRWHSCRNRHCPRCQKPAQDAWRRARGAELLAVPYAHMVFTLPHELNALARAHARWVYDTLLACTAATLAEFCANPRWLGGQGACTLVLHTWSQDLRLHIHVHALVACGALGADARWIAPRRSSRFVFPVHALSKVFAGKFRAALHDAQRRGALPRDPDAQRREQRMQRLRRKPWVVYAKTPLAGPAAVLDYLSRYTHRTAIGNDRIAAIDGADVLLRVRAGDAAASAPPDGARRAGHKKIVRIDGVEFIGRFLQHVLPLGFKRIRHCGILAAAHKARALAAARAALAMPAAQPPAHESAAQFMRRVQRIDIECCAHCRARWHVVQTAAADRLALHEVPPLPRARPPSPGRAAAVMPAGP
ncbi:MAG: IS91 family transposase [Rubrivivax sp.]